MLKGRVPPKIAQTRTPGDCWLLPAIIQWVSVNIPAVRRRKRRRWSASSDVVHLPPHTVTSVCPAELGDLAQAAGSSRGNPNITTTTTATSIKHTFGLCFFPVMLTRTGHARTRTTTRTSLTVTYCKLQLNLQSLSSNSNEHKVKVYNIWL